MPEADGTVAEIGGYPRAKLGLRTPRIRCMREVIARRSGPWHESRGDAGLQNFGWRTEGVTIEHGGFERFGPEEHVSIRY